MPQIDEHHSMAHFCYALVNPVYRNDHSHCTFPILPQNKTHKYFPIFFKDTICLKYINIPERPRMGVDQHIVNAARAH